MEEMSSEFYNFIREGTAELDKISTNAQEAQALFNKMTDEKLVEIHQESVEDYLDTMEISLTKVRKMLY